MLRGAKRQGGTGPTLSSRLQKLLAGITGFLSALMGIGGGTLSVPLLGAAGRHAPRRGNLGLLSVIIAVPAAVGFMIGGWSIPDLPPLRWAMCIFGAGGDDTGQHAGRSDGCAVCSFAECAPAGTGFRRVSSAKRYPYGARAGLGGVRAFGRIHRPLHKTTIIRQLPQTWRAYFHLKPDFPPRQPAPACWMRRAPAPMYRLQPSRARH